MKTFFVTLLVFCSSFSQAQLMTEKKEYTKADSLRGSLRPERTNFDVLKYDLSVKVEPEKKYISGNNNITFNVLEKLPVMQLDLFANMKIDSIIFQGKKLNYKREFNAVFISFANTLPPGKNYQLNFYYSGNPIVANNPPWDGGFIFSKDNNGNDWVSVAVQGTGASLWYPNKDHLSDEPEEAEIHIAAPTGLMDVSNGRLTGKKDLGNGYTQWNWKVTNPINNYDIILNIGDYVHFSDKFNDLDLDYYVLRDHLEKAKKQFEEVKPMLACFTEKFGEYPFKEDSYKLVETPFLGMEHQSAVAYGNQFKMGYAGRDLSKTGVGMLWDFIIVHESGHEWFGNSITASDLADMWIHEAFTSYAESVYIECRWGKEKALQYLKGLRKSMVSNNRPIIGDYGVNKEGSGDMYYKGANMLNTLRSVINNDEKWWEVLKKFALTYKHKIIDTPTVINFFNKETGLHLTPIFNEYLRETEVPLLEFKQEQNTVYYRWNTCVTDFNMPVDIYINEKEYRISPNSTWQKLPKASSLSTIKVDIDRFYIKVNKES